MAEAPKLGWGWPGNSPKAHVFYEGRALCGRWLYGGNTEPITKAPAPLRGHDDCAVCHKKLVARFKPTTAPNGGTP